MTELHRVSGAPGQRTVLREPDYLWTGTPATTADQVIGRPNDGSAEVAPLGESLRYRCVCDLDPPAGFSGHACNGAPDEECFSAGGLNIDTRDRPPLPKSAALYECMAHGGTLPRWDQLVAAIGSALPGGTGDPLHTATNFSFRDGAAIAWVGVEVDWEPVAGLTLHAPAMDARLPFRCVGGAPRAVGSAPVERFQHPISAADMDTSNRSASDWMTAAAACAAEGAHIPTMTELVGMIRAGLPNGAGEVHASDHVDYVGDSAGIEPGSRLETGTVKWTGTAQRHPFRYLPSSSAALVSSVAKRAEPEHLLREYRCLRYTVNPDFAEPSCAGGCIAVPLAAGGATLWFDGVERQAASVGEAVRACAAAGGSLPTERDLTEAASLGGIQTDEYLLVSDLMSHLDTSFDLVELTIKLVRPDADFDGVYVGSGDSSWRSLSTLDESKRKYRCMWTNELR